jgi:hypothetical protein
MAVPESFEVSPVLKRLEREAWRALRDHLRTQRAIADRIRKDDGPWDGAVPIKTRKEAAVEQSGWWLVYRTEAGDSQFRLIGMYPTCREAEDAVWRAAHPLHDVRVDRPGREWTCTGPRGKEVRYRIVRPLTSSDPQFRVTVTEPGSPWVPATYTPKKSSSYFEISASGGIRVGRQR